MRPALCSRTLTVSIHVKLFKAADGLLDEREKLSIALDLERLAGRVEKESRDNPYVSKTIQARKEQADQAISGGSVSGKLGARSPGFAQRI